PAHNIPGGTPQQGLMHYREETRRVTMDARSPLGTAFGVLVAVEAAYYSLQSLDYLISVVASAVGNGARYGWSPVGRVFAILGPVIFWGAAYVLIKPKIAETTLGAMGRPLLVWFAILWNLMLVWMLISRPESVIRWPI